MKNRPVFVYLSERPVYVALQATRDGQFRPLGAENNFCRSVCDAMCVCVMVYIKKKRCN